MKPTTALAFPILLALLTLLQGCGFHLRGTGTSSASLPADISPLHVQGLPHRDFLKLKLENGLVNSGIKITENAAEAASLLRITNRRSDRRVMTVDSRGKVLEYELRESLDFDLLDSSGKARVSTQPISVISIYRYEEQVLGGQQEETFLREDMWRRLSDQVLRRMSIQLR